MTPTEHHAAAERWMSAVDRAFDDMPDEPGAATARMEAAGLYLRAAQVHATLATIRGDDG